MRGSVGTVTFSDDVVTPVSVAVGVSGVLSTVSLGSVGVAVTQTGVVAVAGVAGTSSVGSVTVNSTSITTYTITVVNPGSETYIIRMAHVPVFLAEMLMKAVPIGMTNQTVVTQDTHCAFLPLRTAHMVAA